MNCSLHRTYSFTSREVAEILISHLKAKDIPAPAYVGNTDTCTWEINDDGSVRVEWSENDDIDLT